MSSMNDQDDQLDVEALDKIVNESQVEGRLLREREIAERKSDIRELKQLLSAEQIKRDMLRMISDHAPLLEPPPLRLPTQHRKDKPKHTWVLMVSDWQLGQKTTLEATNDIFEQTSDITAQQVRMLWDKVYDLYQIKAGSIDIDELVIMDLGDIVEGDSMRVSQATKVDQLVTKQVVQATNLLNELVQNALGVFPRVRYHKVGGNHDRISSKPGLAGLGELGYADTFSWLAGAFQQQMFEKAIKQGRLVFHNHESFFGTDKIAGMRCVFEHGASFKASTGSYGGVSYYGLVNAARGYETMLGGADIVMMGHLHRPMLLPLNSGWGWHMVNGALPPSTEFVQSNFKSFGRPCQVLLDLHPEQGLVSWSPIYLDTEKMIRPGQFWGRIEEGVA